MTDAADQAPGHAALALAQARLVAEQEAGSLDIAGLRRAADEVDRKTVPVVCEVLRRLRAFDGATRGLSLVEAAGAMQVAPAYRKLIRRWLLELAQLGIVLRTAQGFTANRLPTVAVSTAAENPHFNAICDMLTAVLTGRHHVLEYVFGSRRPAWLTAYSASGYDADPVFSYQHKVVAGAVGALAGQAGPGRRLDILEIGAGMGSLTAHVLPLLAPDTANYLYTDIAPEFLELGRQRFGDAGGKLRYAVWDINKPPAAAAMPRHGFDVVLAFDVLHCARDLAQTLAWLHGRLRPGGVLINEQLTRNRLSHLIFPGIMPGFTDFEDDRLRDYRTLPTPEAWRAMLEASGFGGCDILPEHGGLVQDPGHGVIIARA